VVQKKTTVKEEIKTFRKIHQETKDQLSNTEINQLKTKEVNTLMIMRKTTRNGTILIMDLTLQISIGTTQTPPLMVVLYQATFQAL
jgi:hypothetical protein